MQCRVAARSQTRLMMLLLMMNSAGAMSEGERYEWPFDESPLKTRWRADVDEERISDRGGNAPLEICSGEPLWKLLSCTSWHAPPELPRDCNDMSMSIPWQTVTVSATTHELHLNQ